MEDYGPSYNGQASELKIEYNTVTPVFLAPVHFNLTNIRVTHSLAHNFPGTT